MITFPQSIPQEHYISTVKLHHNLFLSLSQFVCVLTIARANKLLLQPFLALGAQLAPTRGRCLPHSFTFDDGDQVSQSVRLRTNRPKSDCYSLCLLY